MAAEVLAPRLREVLDHVTHSALTEAARSVLERMPTTPLTWDQLSVEAAGMAVPASAPYHSCCWEAKHEGNLYSLNLLTGEVLFNGAPPGRLPHDIVADPLYQRTFGDRNFEVVPCKDGRSLRTARAIKDAFYEFTPASSCSSKQLRVVELPTRRVTPPPPDSCWRMWTRGGASCRCSCAICTASGETTKAGRSCFVARPFWRGRCILSCNRRPPAEKPAIGGDDVNNDSDGASPWICWRVPHHERRKPGRWEDLALEAYDQLMVPTTPRASDPTLLALAKLESRKFIHVFRRTAGDARWLYELPRFQLQFELLNTGVLRATKYRGYVLALDQQLPDALPNLSQYLVLERAPLDLPPAAAMPQ